MPCSVAITDLEGTDAAPTALRVSGTAVDCAQVRVSTNCTPAGTANVDAAGNWTIELQNAEQCPCEKEQGVWVHVECVGDPSCFQTIPNLFLRCPRPTTSTSTSTTTTSTSTTTTSTTTPAPDCYSVTITFSAPCSQGGNPVAITFSANVIPGPGAPPYAGPISWKVRRKTGNTWSLVASGSGGLSFTWNGFTPGDYTVEVILYAPNCPDDTFPSYSAAFTVLNCDCPTITGGITATQGSNPCVWIFNAPINNPTGAAVVFDWDFGDGTVLTGSTQASPTHTYTSSGTMTVTVTVRDPARPECRDTASVQINVDCGPTSTTSTTPGPTTSSTTTGGPTTSTTSTTTPTTTRPPNGGGGCLCDFLLALALLFIGLAALAFFAWACGGFANVAILVFGIVCAVIGLALLTLWLLVCAALQCAALFVLIDIFTLLVVVMPIVAALLALGGLPNCGIGALVNWGFFGIVLGLLYRLGEIVGCIVRRP